MSYFPTEYPETESENLANETLDLELWETLAGQTELLDPWDHFAILEYEATQPYRSDPYCCAHRFC